MIKSLRDRACIGEMLILSTLWRIIVVHDRMFKKTRHESYFCSSFNSQNQKLRFFNVKEQIDFLSFQNHKTNLFSLAEVICDEAGGYDSH
jgi:hypothetical protein